MGREGRCDRGVMTEESVEMDVEFEGKQSSHYPTQSKSFNLDDGEMEFPSEKPERQEDELVWERQCLYRVDHLMVHVYLSCHTSLSEVGAGSQIS